MLEREGEITKGDFDVAQRIINECRKLGLLPLDSCSEDEWRQADGLEKLDASVDDEVDRWWFSVRNAAGSYTRWSTSLVSCGLIQAGSAVASARRFWASGRALSSGTTRPLLPIDFGRTYRLTCRMMFVQRSTIGSTLSALSGGNIGTTRVTPISLRRFTRSRSSPSATR